MAVPEKGVKPIQYFEDNPIDYFRQLTDSDAEANYMLLDWQAYKNSGMKPSEYYGYDTVEFSGPTAIRKKGSTENLIEQQPTYRSDWDNMADRLARTALDMQYEDWTQGDQYKALADRYGEQGKLSMQDLLGQMSARTGGLASSYAEAVAGQQYNDYMAQLQDVARQMYNNERASAIENAQMALGYAQNDYQRYLDALNQANYEREWSNQLDQQNYARSQNERADAQQRISNFLAMGGSINDVDPALISAAGYNQVELAALGGYYTPKQQTVQYSYTQQPSSSPKGNNGADFKGEAAQLYKEITGKRASEDSMFAEVSRARQAGKISESDKEKLMQLIYEQY